MKVSEMFPTKWISAADLQNREVTVTIRDIAMEQVEQDKPPKPVLYFTGGQKGMVLNKTNSNSIAVLYGDDTDGWSGKPITLHTQWVDFKGEMKQAVRVKLNEMPTAAPALPQEQPPFDEAIGVDDDIPF